MIISRNETGALLTSPWTIRSPPRGERRQTGTTRASSASSTSSSGACPAATSVGGAGTASTEGRSRWRQTPPAQARSSPRQFIPSTTSGAGRAGARLNYVQVVVRYWPGSCPTVLPFCTLSNLNSRAPAPLPLIRTPYLVPSCDVTEVSALARNTFLPFFPETLQVFSEIPPAQCPCRIMLESRKTNQSQPNPVSDAH